MRAAAAPALGDRVDVIEVVLRDPLDDEVTVRLSACGVCHSDLTQIRGERRGLRYPLVVGHEAVGVVERAGSRVTRVRPGDQVILSGIPYCGQCYYCLHGPAVYCAARSAPSRPPKYEGSDGAPVYAYGLGAFAERTVVSELSVVPVTTELPVEQLALLGCAVLTGLGAVLNVARVPPGSSVLVAGAGGVGQSVVQAAALAGAVQVIVSDPVQGKLGVATANGATQTTTASGAELAELCREATGGRGVDFAFDAVGHHEIIRTCCAATRPGGAITAVGLPGPGQNFELPGYDFLVGGQRLQGCLYGGGNVVRDLLTYVGLAEAGKLNLRSLVTDVRPLSEVQQGFDDMISGTAIRTVIQLAG